ncbi:cell growth regulator with EF hand domain protein 1 [Hippocampus zosterae]|uniref:cell growth regulator with EF hand domain protein 1 n=1 Tax=Hippocampus zosterae TaxID=109293 RepID=UPI00223E2E50|nr:cell growth regulator with EF hand domain protein 1 [Hippocampus zosterae]
MKQAGSGCGRGRDTQAVHVCLLPGSSTWLPTHSLFHSVAVKSARLAQCRARGAFTYQLQEEAILLVIERTTTLAILYLTFSLRCVLTSSALIGLIMDRHLNRLVPSVLVLALVLHVHPSQTAPQREDPEKVQPDSRLLTNPFGSGEEERRLLQRYIELTKKDDVRINSRDKEVFYLFRLYDFDRSERLDGLEMMKLLSDYNSQHATEEQANDMDVVSLVDFLLQSQDVNRDGLLTPSELLSLPSAHTEDSQIEDRRSDDQKAILDEGTPDMDTKQEMMEAAKEHEEPDEHSQANQEEVQHEVRAEAEQETMRHADEHRGQQVPEDFAAEQRHEQEVPVHQGQPEI